MKLVITIETKKKDKSETLTNNAQSVAPKVEPALPGPPDCGARWEYDGNHGYL